MTQTRHAVLCAAIGELRLTFGLCSRCQDNLSQRIATGQYGLIAVITRWAFQQTQCGQMPGTRTYYTYSVTNAHPSGYFGGNLNYTITIPGTL